jgi:hypothetical protein
LDRYGHHALSCGGGGNRRITRHNIVARAVHALAQEAGLHPQLEANVQCLQVSTSGLKAFRPADVLLDGRHSDRVCVDITITSPLSIKKRDLEEGTVPGHLAASAAAAKEVKHREACTRSGLGFLPFSVDVCGVADGDAVTLLRRLAARHSASSGRPYSSAVTLCRRRISFAVRVGVASQLLRVQSLAPASYKPVFSFPL